MRVLRLYVPQLSQPGDFGRGGLIDIGESTDAHGNRYFHVPEQLQEGMIVVIGPCVDIDEPHRKAPPEDDASLTKPPTEVGRS